MAAPVETQLREIFGDNETVEEEKACSMSVFRRHHTILWEVSNRDPDWNVEVAHHASSDLCDGRLDYWAKVSPTHTPNSAKMVLVGRAEAENEEGELISTIESVCGCSEQPVVELLLDDRAHQVTVTVAWVALPSPHHVIHVDEAPKLYLARPKTHRCDRNSFLTFHLRKHYTKNDGKEDKATFVEVYGESREIYPHLYPNNTLVYTVRQANLETGAKHVFVGGQNDVTVCRIPGTPSLRVGFPFAIRKEEYMPNQPIEMVFYLLPKNPLS